MKSQQREKDQYIWTRVGGRENLAYKCQCPRSLICFRISEKDKELERRSKEEARTTPQNSSKNKKQNEKEKYVASFLKTFDNLSVLGDLFFGCIKFCLQPVSVQNKLLI